jgi:hypothetical protein
LHLFPCISLPPLQIICSLFQFKLYSRTEFQPINNYTLS